MFDKHFCLYLLLKPSEPFGYDEELCTMKCSFETQG